jgi:hypothetical protein
MLGDYEKMQAEFDTKMQDLADISNTESMADVTAESINRCPPPTWSRKADWKDPRRKKRGSRHDTTRLE